MSISESEIIRMNRRQWRRMASKRIVEVASEETRKECLEGK